MRRLVRHLSPRLTLITLAAAWCVAAPPAAAEILAGVPDVIVCSIIVPDRGLVRGRVVFYLDAQEDAGITYYKSLGSAPRQLRAGPDGVFEEGQLQDCNGKSIDELREAGRAFNIR